MSAQALSLSRPAPTNLRLFDIRRDLLAVADLVELCFASHLDADGRLYIRQMRAAARNPLQLSTDLPLAGFVWQEDGKVVGNLSLIAHRHGSQQLYLIANVAVHPDQRRRGIARALTQAALQEIQRRGPRQTWLQVDQDNLAAVTLYRQMGFAERMRRTSWRARPQAEINSRMPPSVTVRKRNAGDWGAQQKWLQATYPANVRWHLPLDTRLLQPGMRGALERALSERQIEQWSAEKQGRLLGVLTWQSSSLESDRLWLAVDPEHEDEVISALVRQAHSDLRSDRNLALNYPAERGNEALLGSGFTSARKLIWMEYPW